VGEGMMDTIVNKSCYLAFCPECGRMIELAKRRYRFYVVEIKHDTRGDHIITIERKSCPTTPDKK